MPGELPPGTEIGRFQIQALLGQGGMGAVYLAWDPVLERKVALKAIRLGGDGKALTRDRFRREAMALAQLNHRHVCQVHDWVEARGSAYIAMELVEGETLSRAAKGLDPRQKLEVLRDIALALEAAHAKGIVHRDLKPGNVMVDGEGQVKVLDFGLARLMDSAQNPGTEATGDFPIPPSLTEAAGNGPTFMDSASREDGERTRQTSAHGSPSHSSRGDMTEAGTFMGSPLYASPEQMGGKPAGPPSDVFSLGVMAWELLLGEHPFPGEGRARMEATVKGDRKPLRGYLFPRRVRALLRGMLHKNPEKRPTSHRVAESLSRQLAGNPVAWGWAGVAAVFLCALGFGYALFGRSIIADLGKEHPPRMAVMPIRNDTGDPNLDALVGVGMTELLSTALRDSPSLMVVEPESVTRAISSLRMSTGEGMGAAGQSRIAKALGASLILRGSLSEDPVRRVRTLSYELVDLAGRTRFSGAVRVPLQGGFTPYALVDPAAQDLLRKVDPLRSNAIRNAAVPPEVFAAYAKGKALFLKGNFKDSEPYLREASLKAPAFSSAVSAYAACLRRLGRDQALPVANWALMSARATGDRWAEGRVLGLKAYLAKDRGDLDEAQRLREATLSLAQAIGDRDEETIAINHLGIIARERGRDLEARRFYERSLALSQQTGDRFYQSLAQNNLANLALNRGELPMAETLYRTNLDLQREVGNRWGEALALNNLGVVALMARDLPTAEGLVNKALVIRESLGDKAGQISCLRNLGILALMKDQPKVSAERHGRAMALAQEAGMRTVEAECQFYVAELARLNRQFDPARAEYQRVVDLLPEGVTPEIRGNAQAAIAECLVRKARPEPKEAERRLKDLQPEATDSPYVHRAKAWLAFQTGRHAAAMAELDLAIADPRRQAPETQGELEATRAVFLAVASSAGGSGHRFPIGHE